MCGHATLAAAAVLFNSIKINADCITFKTLSKDLLAKKTGNSIMLDFPKSSFRMYKPREELINALGIEKYKNIVYSDNTKMLLVHLPDMTSVINIKPDFEKLKHIKTKEYICGVIVTAKGKKPIDFISRFFAPLLGINEDPVTGSAHTVLTPYWSKLLGKTRMKAYQASERGGKLVVQIIPGNRVHIIGNAVILTKGGLYL